MLYFLILGGIRFSEKEKNSLGVHDPYKIDIVFDELYFYSGFKKWFEEIIDYDLNGESPGLWLNLYINDKGGSIHPKVLDYFSLEEYKKDKKEFYHNAWTCDGTKYLTPFTWERNTGPNLSKELFEDMFIRLKKESPTVFQNISSIIEEIDDQIEILHISMADNENLREQT